MLNREDMVRQHDLTIDEVKAVPAFKHFTDEEAQEVIRTLKRFSEIICKSHYSAIKT